MTLWHPISTAPRDGTPVLVKFIPRLTHLWPAHYAVLAYEQWKDGSGWGVAIPDGTRYIPDRWISGWREVEG